MNQPYKTHITACFTMYVVMMLGDIHLQDAAEVWMVADWDTGVTPDLSCSHMVRVPDNDRFELRLADGAVPLRKKTSQIPALLHFASLCRITSHSFPTDLSFKIFEHLIMIVPCWMSDRGEPILASSNDAGLRLLGHWYKSWSAKVQLPSWREHVRPVLSRFASISSRFELDV